MKTQTYHKKPPKGLTTYFEWEKYTTEPFEELILSWNALRPEMGHFSICISLKIEKWTPYVDYALWGRGTQKSFHSFNEDVESYQDIVITKNEKATGFKIRVEAFDGADLHSFFALHACVSSLEVVDLSQQALLEAKPIHLPPLSQMALLHERKQSFCSPTSTTSIIRHLLSSPHLEPIAFAKNVHDQAFDIYGNWVFNIAQASAELGSGWRCWAGRLQGVGELIRRLQTGLPLVVSVKGSLPGAPTPYDSGHLIAVRGYDAVNKKMLCMDPAYASDQETYVVYDLEAFVDVWQQRRYLAYVFEASSQ